VPLLAFGPSADLTYFLVLGMVAVVNPCGFAMLPAYLSYFLGLDEDRGAERSAPVHPAASVARGARVALVVSAGFMTVFAVAGLAVSHTSLPVFEYAPWISVLIGLALVALGIAMVTGYELVARLPKLERGGRTRTLGSMYVFGVSYAIASIGCTLPIFLSGAVASTMRRDSVVDGLIAFATYAGGMALVLTALTVTMALTRTSLLTVLRSARAYVNTVAGFLVGAAGLYVAFYGVLELRTYRASEPGAIPSSTVTTWMADRSYDITDWVNRVGPWGVTLRLVLLALAVGLIAAAVRRIMGGQAPSAPAGTKSFSR
jgi:cytochrome c-type biogenesis protein